MKTIPNRLFGAAAGAVLLASCGPQLESTSVPMSVSPSVTSDGRVSGGKIHARVNAYRASKGREALPRHPGLDRMAQEHSEFMRMNRGKFMGSGAAANISHHGFEDRALKAQYTMKMSDVAENVATCGGNYGSATETLVNAWINSSGHEKNMKGQWSATGIGVVVDKDGTVFATQIFATESHSHMVMMDRLRQF